MNGKLIGMATRLLTPDITLLHVDVGDDLGVSVRVQREPGVNFKLRDPLRIDDAGNVYWKKVLLRSVE